MKVCGLAIAGLALALSQTACQNGSRTRPPQNSGDSRPVTDRQVSIAEPGEPCFSEMAFTPSTWQLYNGFANTADNSSGTAWFYRDLCGLTKRVRGYRVIFAPFGTVWDFNDQKAIAEMTVLETAEPDLSQMGLTIRLAYETPTKLYNLTTEEALGGLELIVDCHSTCDRSKLTVRRTEFKLPGRKTSKIFIVLRDRSGFSKL